MTIQARRRFEAIYMQILQAQCTLDLLGTTGESINDKARAKRLAKSIDKFINEELEPNRPE